MTKTTKKLELISSSRGATNIKISSSNPADIVIYKKGVLTYKKIKKYTNRKSCTYLAKYSFNNKYKVIVTSKKKSKIKCSIAQYQSSRKHGKKNIWVCSSSSPAVDIVTVPVARFYFTKDEIAKATKKVEDAKILKSYSDFLNGLTTAAVFAGTWGAGKVVAEIPTFVSAVITGVQFKFLSFDLESDFINKIDNVACYSSKTGTAKYGVEINYITIDGVTTMTVDKWKGNNDSMMYGPKGFTGSWQENYGF